METSEPARITRPVLTARRELAVAQVFVDPGASNYSTNRRRPGDLIGDIVARKLNDSLTIPIHHDLKIAIIQAANAEDQSICVWVRQLLEDRLADLGFNHTWPDYGCHGGDRKVRKDKGLSATH